jgi:hypothetical protein
MLSDLRWDLELCTVLARMSAFTRKVLQTKETSHCKQLVERLFANGRELVVPTETEQYHVDSDDNVLAAPVISIAPYIL